MSLAVPAWLLRLRGRLRGDAAGLPGRWVPDVLKSGLQRRLLLLLFLPLGLFALTSIYFDYQTAGNVALQKDQQLRRLIPLLADSVLAPGVAPDGAPLLLLAPEIELFIKNRTGSAGFRISDSAGGFLAGESWMTGILPATYEPEFHSMEADGITYRIAAQRVETAAGELIVELADGSDARQQWLRSVWVKVLLPNLVLVLVGGFAANWAVRRALRPLIELKDAVERRNPRDLSAIEPQATPAEVQPLVSALNRLFGLVNDQAEAQRRFVADAAHQLRTPLAGLQAQVEAWAQAAQTGPGGQTRAVTLPADTIIRLRDATRRTSQLASQLLALSRADASTAAAQPLQQVDLKALCESVLTLHLDAATHKGIDLGLEAEPAEAWGYPWLLRELLGNLVDNAVRYTAPGGTVTLRCGPLDGRRGAAPTGGAAAPDVFLEVEDDGPGIAVEERQRALQRFYRLPGTVGEGNGLGLAIADEIARVHRSQLWLVDGGDDHVASASGKRAGLRVCLPLYVNAHFGAA
ncbi:MAG: sensor histidine kinase [Polaromonas sp.]|nr:sensor histidine kinase [Polaromonas sp.]